MVDEAELNFGELRLLETDNRIVLPVGVAVRVLVTAVMYYIAEQYLRSPLRSTVCQSFESGYFIDYSPWCILWTM